MTVTSTTQRVRAIGYVRVSTANQGEKGYCLAAQRGGSGGVLRGARV